MGLVEYITVLIVVVSIGVSHGDVLCQEDSDCASDECCAGTYLQYRFGDSIVQTFNFTESACVPYLNENDSCVDTFFRRNSTSCGCNWKSNLRCQYFPELDKLRDQNNLFPLDRPRAPASTKCVTIPDNAHYMFTGEF